MRKMIIDRIMFYFQCNGGGRPIENYEIDLRGPRFINVYLYFMEMVFGNSYTPPKRFKERIFISEQDLEKLTDEQLISIFEMVVRRSFVQM
jgi:hypothetical protein